MRILLIVLLVLLALPLVLGLLLLERKPLVQTAAVPTAIDTRLARDLVKRWSWSLKHVPPPIDLSASQDELDAIAALGHRAVPSLTGRARIAPDGTTAALSLRLGKGPLAVYLNASGRLQPSQEGLSIADAKIGAIPVPGSLILAGLELGGNLVLGGRRGTTALEAVRTVRMTGNRVMARLHTIDPQLSNFQALEDRLRDLVGQWQPLGDPAVFEVYYQALVDAGAKSRAPQPSLAPFIGRLFALARERTDRADAVGNMESAETVVSENRAAIMALATYFGDPRFGRFLGTARDDLWAPRPPGHLADRHDLALHFTISAGLHVLSESGMAFAVGEFKELLDSAGGSGFSFADLAADRAGVRFAEMLTEPRTARATQWVLSTQAFGEPGEAAFFPRIDDLPEGLQRAAFERAYGKVDDPRYQALVEEIDRRIADRPAFDVIN